VSIKIGLGMAGFPFSGPKAFLRWIDLLEARGVDSVWLSERLVSRQPVLETIAAFGIIAGRTERLKFGMNAIVAPLRDPLILAKECATLDYLSGGRLLPVFGVGAETAPEWRATGREPVGRGPLADELLELLARLWSEDEVTFSGRHFRYEHVSISPRPVQQPLPLWIGGSSEAAIRRTARLGTGWLGGLQTPAQAAPVVAAIKREAAALGRTIDEDHYGAGFAFRFGTLDEPVVEQSATALRRAGIPDPLATIAVGDAETVAAKVEEYTAAGVSKFVLRPLASGDDDLMAQTERLIEEVLAPRGW